MECRSGKYFGAGTVLNINIMHDKNLQTKTTKTVAVAPGSTMLNASASGRDADFPGSRGSGVSGT